MDLHRIVALADALASAVEAIEHWPLPYTMSDKLIAIIDAARAYRAAHTRMPDPSHEEPGT